MLGRKVEQSANGAGGAAARAQLQHLAEKHERDDRRSRLEVNIRQSCHRVPRRWKQTRRDGCDRAIDIGHADAHRDQREHVGAAELYRCPAALEKRPAAPQHDGRRQRELDPVAETRGGWNAAARLMRGIIRNMAKATSGMPITTLVQKRRVMSRSSGFSSVAAVTVFGSSAMPQMGHAPGPSRTISGCIGQVHCVFVGATGSSGSSAMPHFGTCAGVVLPDLGIHRADVRRRGHALCQGSRGCRNRRRRQRRQEFFRFSFEFFSASLAAEIVCFARVGNRAWRFRRVHSHPANGIFFQLAGGADLPFRAAQLHQAGGPGIRFQVLPGIAPELFGAATRAEMVQLASILDGGRSLGRIDDHAADRVFLQLLWSSLRRRQRGRRIGTRRGVLRRRGHKLVHAGGRAEVIRLAVVLRFTASGHSIDDHPANRIFGRKVQLQVSRRCVAFAHSARPWIVIALFTSAAMLYIELGASVARC